MASAAHQRAHRIAQHLLPRADQPQPCGTNATATTASPASSAPTVFDVVIIGVGAQGVSTALHLAKAGKKVLGLERYTLAHANGSSHGETRITRLAYWEHPDYVPLLRRSFELFDELETEAKAHGFNEPLFQRTGSMDIGPEAEATFAGSLLSCRTHGLEHEVLTPEQLAERFPAWSVPAHYRACFQPAGGMLFPERVVSATAMLARKHGAILKENTEVLDLAATEDGGVVVRSTTGEVFHARHVVLAAGAWLPTLLNKSTLARQSSRLAALAGMLKVERQVVTWYNVPAESSALFAPQRHPVWVATHAGHHYYGFPLLAHGAPGAKIGRYHHKHEMITSEAALNNLDARHATQAEDRLQTDDFMRKMFRKGAVDAADHQPVLKMQTCMFTLTPDEHFLVDARPDAALPQVSLISACSGHGFKFSSVLGEIMARFVLEGAHEVEKTLPVRWLDAGRFLGDRPPMQVLDPCLEMAQKKL